MRQPETQRPPKTHMLPTIKRVLLQRKLKAELEFSAPADVGKKSHVFYFMCDSYMGCDQEYGFTLDVKEANDGEDEWKTQKPAANWNDNSQFCTL